MSILASVVLIVLFVGLVYVALKIIYELKHPQYESDEEKRTK
jgi:uncharacterized membrane protein YhdT